MDDNDFADYCQFAIVSVVFSLHYLFIERHCSHDELASASAVLSARIQIQNMSLPDGRPKASRLKLD